MINKSISKSAETGYNFSAFSKRDKHLEINEVNIMLKKSYISCVNRTDKCIPELCKSCKYKMKNDHENYFMIKRRFLALLNAIDTPVLRRNKRVKNNEYMLKIRRYWERPVKKFDLEGNFICEYGSIKEAAEENKTSAPNIGKCCKNNNLTSKGFRWEYSYSERKRIEK